MTFEEWFAKDGLPIKPFIGYNLEDVSRRAWDAALENAARDALERCGNTIIYGTSHPEMFFGKSFASMPEYVAEQEATNGRLREMLDRTPTTDNQQGRK